VAGLNWVDIYFSRGLALDEPSVKEILAANKYSSAFGLKLKPEEALLLIAERNRIIRDLGRVETGLEIITSIINAFCSSVFINSDEYVSILNELVEIFYLFKNETENYVDDDELVNVMSELYNNSCQGSLELLRYKELPRYAANIKEGLSGRKAER
jgi:hypothetical protein